MKNEYRLYGTDTAKLEEQLSQSDQSVLRDFLTFCAVTAGPGKVATYKRYMLQFADVVERPLDSITKQDAVQFWALVNHAPYEVATKSMVRRTVKRFLKWFYRDMDMLEPLRNVNRLVNSQRINKAALLKPHEIQLMLHKAEKIRDKALLVLLYETAARPQEVRDLRWSDVNWEESEVHLHSRKKSEGRDLPVREAIKHLKRWQQEWIFPDPKESDFIFPSMSTNSGARGKPISVSYINRIIKSVAKRAGVVRPVHTYLLRHTRLTELYRKGVKGIEHNKFAGHRPGSAQQNVYVHIDNADMKRSVLEKVYAIEDKQAEDSGQIAALKSELAEIRAFLRELRSLKAA